MGLRQRIGETRKTMTMARIHRVEVSDPRLDVFRDLPRRPSGSRAAGCGGARELFVVEGESLTARLLRSGLEVESVATTPARAETFAERAPSNTAILAVEGDLSSLVGFRFHRGVLAAAVRPASVPLERIAGAEGPTVVVVLEGIADPANLGGLVRTAAAFGARGVVVDARAADPFSRRAVRVSMGALFGLECSISGDLVRDLDRLRELGFETVATSLDSDAVRLERWSPSSRVALVLGNEGHGVSRRLAEACAHRVRIPMRETVDSLNVNVAAGAFLWEIARRRAEF